MWRDILKNQKLENKKKEERIITISLELRLEVSIYYDLCILDVWLSYYDIFSD